MEIEHKKAILHNLESPIIAHKYSFDSENKIQQKTKELNNGDRVTLTIYDSKPNHYPSIGQVYDIITSDGYTSKVSIDNVKII